MNENALENDELDGDASHSAASFTDLMTSLMVIFILLFVATVNNASKSREKVQRDLLETLRSQLAAKGLDTTAIKRDDRDPYAIVIVMPDSLLFERDSARVQGGGQRYLAGVIPTIAGILCSEEMAPHIDNVVVEGHTDTTYAGVERTPGQGRAYNLQLSQERSMAVVKSSLGSLADRPASEKDCFRKTLSASGRGQEEPLLAIPGDDARQRRVIFKIRVKADMASQLARGASSATVHVVQHP